MNPYLMLADLIVFIHALYVATVVFGFVAILLGIAFRWQWVRNPVFRLVHFFMIAIVAFQAVMGWACPLTIWEHQLRIRGGGEAQFGTFIGYWVHRLIMYDFPPWVFTLAYCVFAALVLLTLILSPPMLRSARRQSRLGNSAKAPFVGDTPP